MFRSQSCFASLILAFNLQIYQQNLLFVQQIEYMQNPLAYKYKILILISQW